MAAERRFLRLKAPELRTDVYLGTRYLGGVAVGTDLEEVAA